MGPALAYRDIPLRAAYCGPKHAVQGFTESLRCELRAERSGFPLTRVQPRAVDTPQFTWTLTRTPRRPRPVPPIDRPEVAAGAVREAAEHPDVTAAFRRFERNRSAAGSPGLLTEEVDVRQRQLRGNLPQAFVHAMLLETSVRLGQLG